MLPFYIQDTITNNNHAINSLISQIADEIGETETASSSVTSTLRSTSSYNLDEVQTCGTLYDITDQIPNWVIYEKAQRSSSGQSTLTIFDFIQKYYDWLYCDASTGSQYGLSRNILDLIDIRKTREEFIRNIFSSYAPGFDKLFTSPNLSVGRKEIETFFSNIRTNFYHKKGTEQGIRKLLTTLFVIDENEIQIEYGKTQLLRLNGGKFYDDKFTFRTDQGSTGTYLVRGDLAGSYLNSSKFQDGNWFHDYSYLLFVGDKYQTNNDLEELYREVAHPAGMQLVFGKQLSDFTPVEPDDEDATVCEYPLLRNYAPYQLFTSYNSVQANYSGITFYGITACVGCCGASYSGFSGPTHRFPGWAFDGFGAATNLFFKINISDFIILCGPAGITSPNENLTCTGCS
jgi:hypothetical protein